MEEDEQGNVRDEAALQIAEKEETETGVVVSEEMELNITHIFERIERFTNLVAIIYRHCIPYILILMLSIC